jgi:hypothetical protein
MTDALYPIFGSKIELFNKNIPALQSRLGGAPFFFPPPGSRDYGNFVDFELERVRSTVATAAENYRDSDGFVAPEIQFSDGLKEKLYQDQIDANAGYRGLQGAIFSVVFGAVNQEVTVDLLSSFRSRAAGDGQVNVRKRSPKLPKKIVFDYNAERNAISVFYDARQNVMRTIGARLLSQNESKLLRKKNDAFFSNQLSAIWLAGEITLTSLLFESLPGIDVSFVVDTKGVQERAKQEIPEWSLDATNNWPAEADNILAHFAGGAAMIAIAPYVGVLPESESRFAIAETLIANLHKKLREEALKAVGPQTNDEKLEGAKDIIGRLGSGYLKEHPVYRVLLKYVKNRDLSQEQIAEVQKAALGYMVQYGLDHQPLIDPLSAGL